jgi:MFS family permease
MTVSVLLGLSISVVTSASAAYIADLSKKGSHGSAMGMLGSIMDIGHTTGPIVGGILAVSYGLTASFLSACAVLVLSILCFISLQDKENIHFS